MTNEAPKRTIKQKAYNVFKNGAFVGIAYGATEAGAIRAARDAEQKQAEPTWEADLASGEDLFLAARDGTKIINPPDSIKPPDPQTDAFDQQ